MSLLTVERIGGGREKKRKSVENICGSSSYHLAKVKNMLLAQIHH